MAADDGREQVADFASWLRGLRLDAGEPSLRNLSRSTRERAGREVPRTTLAAAFAGDRLPSYDTAMAVVRVLAGPDMVEEAHRRWRRALAAQRGEASPDDAPTPPPPVVPEPARVAPRRAGRRPWLIGAGVAGAVVLVAVSALVLASGADDASGGAHGRGSGRAGTEASTSPLQLGVRQVSPCVPMYYPDMTRQQLDADVAASGQGDDPGPLPYPVDVSRAGSPADLTQITITVQSAQSESVLVTGMSVVVRRRTAAPTRGVFVSSGECGAHVDVRLFETDLAHRPVAVTPQEGSADFPFTVSRTDPEVFRLDVADRIDHCVFDVRIDWTSQGHAGHTELTNHGRHYELTGVGRLPAYYGGLDPRTYMTADPNPSRTG
ncbi:MAG TPA: hypothetical protein VGN37_11325 [Actinocatenispora sp.]